MHYELQNRILIKRLIPDKIKRDLYYAYCFSRIIYGIEVYGTAANISIHKLQVLQNRILKTLYNKDWYTTTSVLHKDLNFLQIKDIVSLFQLVFVHNHQLGNLPENFSEYYITRENIHNRMTRYRKQIYLCQVKTNIGSKSIKKHRCYLI